MYYADMCNMYAWYIVQACVHCARDFSPKSSVITVLMKHYTVHSICSRCVYKSINALYMCVNMHTIKVETLEAESL